MRATLTLTCTDGQQHAASEIAQIIWQAADATDGVVYDLAGTEGDVPAAKSASVRSTALGNDRHVDRAQVQVVKRADGGRTFHFPRCPRCGKTPPPMRDDTLNKLRSWQAASLDMYLLRK